MPHTLQGPRFPLLQALHILSDPIGFVKDASRRYGDPFFVRVPFGDFVVTGDAEWIKEIFAADPNLFEAPVQTFLKPLMGENSLFLLTGERHKRERKLLMPPFHGERMRTYGEIFQQIARRIIERVRPGEVFEVQEVAVAISLETITRAIFGVEETERVMKFMDLLAAYSKSYNAAIAMFPALRHRFGGIGPWARFQRLHQELDTLLTEQITRRRAQSLNREDILGLMMSARDEQGQPMTEPELKDELRALLFAGHETTTISLAWALYLIHRHPEVKQRLDEELGRLGPRPEPEALAKLPYLGAVCDETLRLYPPVPVVGRKLRASMTIKGQELPAGVELMPSIPLAHSKSAIYPEPDRFRPERFLERRFSPFEYLPFGGGARRCIGAAFSIYELKVVLGTLLAGYRFTPRNERPLAPVYRSVSLWPNKPILLRYEGPVAAPAAAA